MTNQIVLKKENFIEKDGLLYMPFRELARFLGYKDIKKVGQLYKRHEKELSKYKGVLKLSTPGGEQEFAALNEIGCYTITMFAQTEKAVQFRQSLAELLLALRKGDVELVRKVDALENRVMHLEFNEVIRERQRIIRGKNNGVNERTWSIIANMLEDGISEDKIFEYTGVKHYLTRKIREIEAKSNVYYAPLKKAVASASLGGLENA